MKTQTVLDFIDIDLLNKNSRLTLAYSLEEIAWYNSLIPWEFVISLGFGLTLENKIIDENINSISFGGIIK